MKKVKSLLFVALSLALFVGCSDDDDNNLDKDKTRVEISIKTTLESAESSPLQIDSFQINIADINFDASKDSELKGSYSIDLLKDKSTTRIVVTTDDVSNNDYEGIEFDLEVYKGDDENFKKLKNKTIYANGNFIYNEVPFPFVIISENELEIEIKEKIKLTGGNYKLALDIDLDFIVSKLVEGIETTGMDNLQLEDDYSIEISKDKNATLLSAFEGLLKGAFSIEEVK